MQVVAMDLRRMGLYVSRTLSFQDCSFDIVEESLSERMRTIYDAASNFWMKVYLKLGVSCCFAGPRISPSDDSKLKVVTVLALP